MDTNTICTKLFSPHILKKTDCVLSNKVELRFLFEGLSRCTEETAPPRDTIWMFFIIQIRMVKISQICSLTHMH